MAAIAAGHPPRSPRSRSPLPDLRARRRSSASSRCSSRDGVSASESDFNAWLNQAGYDESLVAQLVAQTLHGARRDPSLCNWDEVQAACAALDANEQAIESIDISLDPDMNKLVYQLGFETDAPTLEPVDETNGSSSDPPPFAACARAQSERVPSVAFMAEPGALRPMRASSSFQAPARRETIPVRGQSDNFQPFMAHLMRGQASPQEARADPPTVQRRLSGNGRQPAQGPLRGRAFTLSPCSSRREAPGGLAGAECSSVDGSGSVGGSIAPPYSPSGSTCSSNVASEPSPLPYGRERGRMQEAGRMLPLQQQQQEQDEPIPGILNPKAAAVARQIGGSLWGGARLMVAASCLEAAGLEVEGVEMACGEGGQREEVLFRLIVGPRVQ